MLPAPLAVLCYNAAVLDYCGFSIYHLLIDNGGAVLAIQQCNMVPQHKVRSYVLSQHCKHNTCPYYLSLKSGLPGSWDSVYPPNILKNTTFQKLSVSIFR
jgi:hypothetical protein